MADEPHAQTLGDADGRRVVGFWDGVHALKSERRERFVQGGAGSLGRVAMTPCLRRESPTDLDRRKDLGEERRHGESDEPDEFLGGTYARSPQPETEIVPFLDLRIEELLRFGASEAAAEREPPDFGLSEDGGELVEIAGNEPA